MHVQPSHPHELTQHPHKRRLPAMSAEVLLGSGVLAAWIVAIYVGLAFFKRMARTDSERQPSARSEQRTVPREGAVPREDRERRPRAAGYPWPSTS